MLNLRRAAERVDRLMRDDRFGGHDERLVLMSARDMLDVAEVIGRFETVSRDVHNRGGRKARRAVTQRSFGDDPYQQANSPSATVAPTQPTKGTAA